MGVSKPLPQSQEATMIDASTVLDALTWENPRVKDDLSFWNSLVNSCAIISGTKVDWKVIGPYSVFIAPCVNKFCAEILSEARVVFFKPLTRMIELSQYDFQTLSKRFLQELSSNNLQLARKTIDEAALVAKKIAMLKAIIDLMEQTGVTVSGTEGGKL